MGCGPTKQLRTNRKNGKHFRTQATQYLSFVRQMQLNAIERPLCPVCGLRRLIRAEDKAAGRCTECRFKATKTEEMEAQNGSGKVATVSE